MMTNRHSGEWDMGSSSGGRGTGAEVQLGCGNMYSLNINEQCNARPAGLVVKSNKPQ